MVTPALKKVFESEGIGLVPLTDGGQFVVQELSTPGRSVEVVAMGKLRGNVSHTPHTIESPTRSAGRLGGATTGLSGTHSMSQTATPAPELSLAFERTVDVASHPMLRSHVLDGRAVLPMAIHLEWLAHSTIVHDPPRR